MDEHERETAVTAALNLHATGLSQQASSSSRTSSRVRRSHVGGVEARHWDGRQEEDDINGVHFDPPSDGNFLDRYVGAAGAIGLFLVLVVAAVMVASLWMLI